ncbi:TPA: hypothetical protein N3288_000226 [Klebsiella aerogenes]|nr:hypothetical protein [Klebsiella aerogenes]
MNYSGKDNILFHLMDDMSLFLKLTATQQMTYNSNMTVSQKPVMSGANVADNFSRQPRNIAINGVVVVQYYGAFTQTMQSTTVEDFVATVERWRDEKRLVRVICKDGISLQNCVIQNFQATKNKDIANGLQIEMTFTQIDLVKEAQIIKVKTSGKVNAGGANSNGSPSGAKTKDGSVQGKADKGKQSTVSTQSIDACKAYTSRADADYSADPELWQVQHDCYDQSNVKHGAVTYSGDAAKNAQAYDLRHPAQAAGNNINLGEQNVQEPTTQGKLK